MKTNRIVADGIGDHHGLVVDFHAVLNSDDCGRRLSLDRACVLDRKLYLDGLAFGEFYHLGNLKLRDVEIDNNRAFFLDRHC